ncbi:MAG TPA: 1,4-alpha-glucan branching protein GlgB, partial [Planctomycetota bacterium]|nr:1,4-alpha-glucan branching protein GlgB [Planctomycetota bacterium]
MTYLLQFEPLRSEGPAAERRSEADDRSRLFSLRHAHPHGILGIHPAPSGAVIRAWRPDAAAITVRGEQGERIPMVRLGNERLFQAEIPGQTPDFRYRLEIETLQGQTLLLEDPYRFLPTVAEAELRLFADGKHQRIQDHLGAHDRECQGVRGVSFAVWAPNAEGVSVVGDWNHWDGRMHPMRRLNPGGVWELFVPEAKTGDLYKYEIHGGDGRLFLKTDPCAFSLECPPHTASRVTTSRYRFQDEDWMVDRALWSPWTRPISIYEVHLSSWCRVKEEGNRPMTYREIAPFLAGHVSELGFTHVEFMPLMEHPYGPSWGYQVSGYFAPTARFGTPDDFRYLVDFLHQQGIGVLMDWVPAHFPKDAFALGRFDGTALYEHWDRRRGEHPDWDTYIFNYGRHEVRSFLISNALYWLSEFHIDGLRLDAVASMLYLDYSRSHDWLPNQHGGRENLEAVSFLRELNEVAHRDFPHVLLIAEESTAWGSVSRPTTMGGLGFGFKWNMGWMHDTLRYFSKQPVYRKHHHYSDLTFGLLYAWTENFILPLSHDEVVHGKGSLLDRMPGTRKDRFAQLRALYGYMWAHPGKKLLFMGGEFGQWKEWNHAESLDWHLCQEPDHRGLMALVRDLNARYLGEPALWACDGEPAGFEWLDAWSADDNLIAFLRTDPRTNRRLISVSNF